MADKKHKRKAARYASVYYVDQIEELDIAAALLGVSRAHLLKEGADIMVARHRNIIDKFKQENE